MQKVGQKHKTKPFTHWYKSTSRAVLFLSCKTFQELKDFIKRDLGVGFENFVYATPEGIKRATTTDEIPEEYRTAQYTMGRLKSWRKYTKRERRETMDALIAQMLLEGVQTKKFNEIMMGMEGLWQKKD